MPIINIIDHRIDQSITDISILIEKDEKIDLCKPVIKPIHISIAKASIKELLPFIHKEFKDDVIISLYDAIIIDANYNTIEDFYQCATRF